MGFYLSRPGWMSQEKGLQDQGLTCPLGNPLILDIFWVQVPWLVYPVPRPLRGSYLSLTKCLPSLLCFVL